MNHILVKTLSKKDIYIVQNLDERSGNDLEQWLDDEGYSYGIFLDENLIGYCSIGYANDICNAIETYPGKTEESLLLNDVYILPEYRGHKYGLTLIKEAIRLKSEFEGCNELIFCQPICSQLHNYYKTLGFQVINTFCMVKPTKRNLEIEKDEVEFT